MTQNATAIYAVTAQGAALAAQIRQTVPADIFLPASLTGKLPENVLRFIRLRELVRETFSAYSQHVFITAAGIAVRSIAPHLQDKYHDPAVVVVDQRGRHVVSLLSGHLGGANALAEKLARCIGATPVITTATDTENLPALDLLARHNGLRIANPRAVATVGSALLAGAPVSLDDPEDRLHLRGSPWAHCFVFSPPRPSGYVPATANPALAAPASGHASRAAHVTVTPYRLPLRDTHLVLHPPVLCVGIGCRRNVSPEDILEVLRSTLDTHLLAAESIACLASADIKKDEAGLHAAAKALAVPLLFFPSGDMATVQVTAPSAKAQEMFGLDGVCEPAAVLAAGARASLLVPKTVGRSVTIAVALG